MLSRFGLTFEDIGFFNFFYGDVLCLEFAPPLFISVH